MTETTKCPKPLELAVFFLERRGPIDAHVRDCAACRAQLQELEAERKAFLVGHPFSSFWNALEARRGKRPSVVGRLWRRVADSGGLRAAAAMASVAGLMILVLSRYQAGPAPETSKDILTKGGVGIHFYVAAPEGEQPERGKSGMRVPAGTGLQFLYSGGKPYLLFLGVEADGALTVYHPSGGSESAAIEAGNQKKLPQALRWQPKTGYERFYGIFSDEPVKVEDVKKAVDAAKIEHTAKLPLPYPQASVILYRE